mgnify:CR=1 FL=1|tara:strand:- start:20334 stop:20969 length:636 start_codon:yes stop_codon:yes gene_type:complete
MKIRIVALALIPALFLSSCQTTNIAETPDELKTMRQAKITWAGAGAISGAAVGAGIAALSGGSSTAIRNAAIGGGIAGLVAGHQVGTQKGTQTVEKKRSYTATEDYLAGQISNAQKFNSALVSYNSKLRGQIASAKSSPDGAAIRGQIKTANAVLKEVDSEMTTRTKLLENAESGPSKNTLTQKKNSLAQQKKQLENSIAELEELEKISKV